MRTSVGQTPILWPLLLVVTGALLLLDNFLLIEIDIQTIYPIVLIWIGLQLLWRGDIAPSWQAQTFGVTRGNVTEGQLEISSGEIDVKIRPSRNPERLIEGQYTARSRPSLKVRNRRAVLKMQRGTTWLFSLADWQIELARDLTWTLLASTHLGQLDIDMRGLQVERAYVASGIGDIRLICSDCRAGEVVARSNLGDVRLAIPDGIPAIIRVEAGPLCRIIRHSKRYLEQPDLAIVTQEYDPDSPAITVKVSATFGNIHLISVPSLSKGERRVTVGGREKAAHY
ncbi:MAG: hypothetical protein CUN55_09445 [Phototrophicales bacterium]|nr:MAG: hypothetical protein CUN55_09445 [Phototrophicales bacterium]